MLHSLAGWEGVRGLAVTTLLWKLIEIIAVLWGKRLYTSYLHASKCQHLKVSSLKPEPSSATLKTEHLELSSLKPVRTFRANQ